MFKGSPDGSSPWAAPIHDTHGNFYGTTWSGGKFGFGTVFEVDSTGKETILHDFAGGSDGAFPWSGLIMDAAGNLYGTTNTGGGAYCFNNYGCGVVFKMSPKRGGGWTETVLYAFKGKPDGQHPGYGSLAQDAAGNLYGTTIDGGGGYCSAGCGVVFKLARSSSGHWKETVLHSFNATQTDGVTPYGGVILDAAGNAYGTTSLGGSSSCGCGTVFKLDATGKATILYSFTGGADGAQPFGALVRDSAGNLYGTTWDPATGYNYGTVYKLDPSGTKTSLHSFTGYPSDGAAPIGALVRDSAGNLYGTTYFGGNGNDPFCETNHQPQGCGAVFKVDKNGKETILHNFVYSVDGAEISAGVTLDAKGNLYGGASVGGNRHNGLVYKLSR